MNLKISCLKKNSYLNYIDSKHLIKMVIDSLNLKEDFSDCVTGKETHRGVRGPGGSLGTLVFVILLFGECPGQKLP